MPKMTGVEMIKEIRKIEDQLNLNPTPIIIVTGEIISNIKVEGNYCEGEKEYCLNTLGVNYYFSKPISFSSLLQRITELIQNPVNMFKLRNRLQEEEKTQPTMLKILIADDDLFCSGILKTILEEEKYECFQTFSVKEVNSN